MGRTRREMQSADAGWGAGSGVDCIGGAVCTGAGVSADSVEGVGGGCAGGTSLAGSRAVAGGGAEMFWRPNKPSNCRAVEIAFAIAGEMAGGGVGGGAAGTGGTAGAGVLAEPAWRILVAWARAWANWSPGVPFEPAGLGTTSPICSRSFCNGRGTSWSPGNAPLSLNTSGQTEERRWRGTLTRPREIFSASSSMVKRIWAIVS